MATLKYILKSSVKSRQEDGEIRKNCSHFSSLGRLAYCQPMWLPKPLTLAEGVPNYANAQANQLFPAAEYTPLARKSTFFLIQSE